MTQCAFCSQSLTDLPKPSSRPIFSVCGKCMNPLLLTHDDADWQVAAPRAFQDIRHVAQEGSIGAEILNLLPEAIERLPILPEIAHRILALVRAPDGSMQDLIDLINQDQVIALKILRLANSPVYGGLAEIKDLRSACARLGMRVIANTVQAIANGRIYRTSSVKYQDLMEDLWCHALATAQCANDIAVLIAEPCADVLFVAGLIHDVGKVLLLDLVANHDSPTMKTLRDSPELFEEVISGYHTIVGLHITRRWNLPPEFGVTTFCHDRLMSIPDESWLTTVHVVALASAVANVAGFGAEQSEISLLSLPSTKFLGLNDIKLASLRIDLEDKVEALIEVMSE